jgi:VWFA-related protein
MTARHAFVCSIGLAIAIASPIASPRQDSRKEPQTPTYRSGVTAVPIDVRVIDKDGKPIVDLRQEDFTVLEDGVPQAIAHFAATTLVAKAPRPELRARPETPAFTTASATAPQDYRVFLIVFGTRGLGDTRRHPETRDALLDFVRHKLLPQDQLALLAGNRASDFTSDHEKVARMLEGFGLPTAPPGAAQARRTPDPAAPATGAAGTPPRPDPAPFIDTDLGFAEYVKARSDEPLDEFESLIYGINYLRFVEGEKHLIYVTERGFDIPSYDSFNGIWNFKEIEGWQHMKQLTRAANDARVALNAILIGERVITMPIPRDMPVAAPVSVEKPAVADPESRPPTSVVSAGGQPTAVAAGTLGLFDPTPAERFFFGLSPLAAAAGVFVDYDLRQTAERTGGQSWMYDDAGAALGRIDDATRTHYLLAYYPSNGNWDGRIRTVTVTVNRPGAAVLYRHSYSASPEIEAFDRRRVVADSRIEAAGHQSREIRDIDVKVIPSFTMSASGRGGEVVVPVSIGPSRLAWSTAEDGRHTAHLQVAVYCGNSSKILAQARRQWNLALTDATFERVSKDRFSREIRIPAPAKPDYVKVIVYDYDADRVGSALAKVK